MKKNVLVVGTGTIGSPLIGFLSDFRKHLDINVFFHKRTPLDYEVARISNFVKRGAKLIVNEDVWDQFEHYGNTPHNTFIEAALHANVIIDCTPAGNKNKSFLYKDIAITNPETIFIAQGSEKDFGVPYAHGINDSVLADNKFIQVVSCNTHSIARILKTLSSRITGVSDIINSDFVCIRRANDISQEGSFIPGPVVDKHSDNEFGTHHARDVYDLYNTIDKTLPIFSSAMKVNTQYMHTIRFQLALIEQTTQEKILQRIREDRFVALTKKRDVARIFSYGRDHGYYGRILNQAVIAEDSLLVNTDTEGFTRISGFSFTPQDGNSLLSSLAATVHALHGNDFEKYMKPFYEFLFSEI